MPIFLLSRTVESSHHLIWKSHQIQSERTETEAIANLISYQLKNAKNRDMLYIDSHRLCRRIWRILMDKKRIGQIKEQFDLVIHSGKTDNIEF